MNNTLQNKNIDIILPNYNSAPHIKETLDSIISQSFRNWKLFIIDDNSNIETKNILKKYENHPNINILWLNKNKKAGFCRNLGLRISKSDYIAFIDSDDIWENEKLSKQLSFMIKNNHLFTYTNYKVFKSKNGKQNIREVALPKTFSFDTFIKNTSIGTSTMMIKKKSMGNIKFTNTKICEDYFFKCKILKKVHYAHCLPESLTKYRVRKNSLQSNKLRNIYWIWFINKRYNKFHFMKNLISLLFISFNSVKKYGLK